MAEPVASLSQGRKAALEPLPTAMTISRLPPYGVAGLPARCRPISQRILLRTKFAPSVTAPCGTSAREEGDALCYASVVAELYQVRSGSPEKWRGPGGFSTGPP